MTVLDSNYFKVDIQYLQKSQLLVVAKTAEEAVDMVKKNVNEDAEQFQVNGAVELTDDEKLWVLKNMQGIEEVGTDVAEPSGEVADTRTLN